VCRGCRSAWGTYCMSVSIKWIRSFAIGSRQYTALASISSAEQIDMRFRQAQAKDDISILPGQRFSVPCSAVSLVLVSSWSDYRRLWRPPKFAALPLLFTRTSLLPRVVPGGTTS
jgi:hypothetical protein